MIRLVPLSLALFLIAFPGESFACGSAAQSFQRMRFVTDAAKLDAFLVRYSCGTSAAYAPDRADTHIAQVLVNAARARISKEKITNVLSAFNCAAQARHLNSYVEIKAYIGAERFASACDPEILSRVYVVTATGGANLREEPRISGSKLGAIAEGIAVRNGRREGDWVLVDTYLGEGYMHTSTLRRYLGDS